MEHTPADGGPALPLHLLLCQHLGLGVHLHRRARMGARHSLAGVCTLDLCGIRILETRTAIMVLKTPWVGAKECMPCAHHLKLVCRAVSSLLEQKITGSSGIPAFPSSLDEAVPPLVELLSTSPKRHASKRLCADHDCTCMRRSLGSQVPPRSPMISHPQRWA